MGEGREERGEGRGERGEGRGERREERGERRDGRGEEGDGIWYMDNVYPVEVGAYSFQGDVVRIVHEQPTDHISLNKIGLMS